MFVFKCLKAIAFAPPNEAEKCFQALVNSDIWDHRLDEFCNNYFRVSLDTYLILTFITIYYIFM